MTVPSPRRRRVYQFGLLQLLLFTAVVAVWLPAILSHQKITELEVRIPNLKRQTAELMIEDDRKLCARSLLTYSPSVRGWKVYVPESADLEVRLATEGIQKISSPAHYQAAPLSTDEQTIYPNSPTWVLPGFSDSSKSGENTDSAGDIQVEVSTAKTFSDTGIAVPSGAVVDQVRLTVPMPMIDPIWLRYEPALVLIF